ncbi:hypothetical protein BDW59DRAFT_167925 [Aspergillus cavernicola]|uniref:Uncharacterized protein n=1 Tax=Aspergillus cavernicola TaxID=176166 RepID=A0ABR4H8Y9_9EURO
MKTANRMLNPTEPKFVAFDDDSQGAWGAATGDKLPVDQSGGYSCTWGEFDFSNQGKDGWSGWDVSAIQAQSANQTVQGMEGTNFRNAYSSKEKGVDGIGGSQGPGAVRLITIIGYDE